MSIFRSRNSSDGPPAGAHKAQWRSAGRGTWRATSGGQQLGDYPTRRAALRAARIESARRGRNGQ